MPPKTGAAQLAAQGGFPGGPGFGQGPGGRGPGGMGGPQEQKIVKQFDKEEVMVRFKCNVHPWMVAWVGVVSHPFFAVTGEDGTFTLKGLPPGEYTLEAWHEKLGTQTQTVTVAPTETKDVAMTFKL